MKISTFMRRNQILSILMWIFFSTLAIGQNGQFDVRFQVKTVDCQTQKVTIALQVRAHDAAHTFLMGDANYRFEYDPRLISNPVIASQENFSNLAPASDLNYGVQNLNGSTAGPTLGIVSLNTFYSGGASGARRVGATDWTTVSCLRFDIRNPTACFWLHWHDDQTFPISGMNEVEISNTNPFEYNLYVVATGGIWQNIDSYCPSRVCNVQPPVLTITPPAPIRQDSNTTFCINISDANGDTTFTASVCGVNNGTATIVSTSATQVCVRYQPNSGFVGTDSICVSVCDPSGACTRGNVGVTVTPRPNPNRPPVLAITPPAPILRDSNGIFCINVSDPDGATTFTASICGVNDGTATVVSTSATQVCVRYQPNPGFVGTDSICISVCDPSGACTRGNVGVTVMPRPNLNTPPVLSPRNLTITADSVLSFCTTITDPDANERFTTRICGAQHGTARASVVNGQVCVTYTSNPLYLGNDTLCVEVCDASGACTSSRFPIVITANNGGGRGGCANDSIAPVIVLTNPRLLGVRNGDTLRFSCSNPPVFGVNDARATDNSGVTPRLSFVDIGRRVGNCLRDGFIVEMQCDWVASDTCGNTSRFKIWIQIYDNNAPILGGTPADVTVNLSTGGVIPTAPIVTATDSCGTATVTMRETSTVLSNCDYVLSRTWTATDQCGNTATKVQRITVLRTLDITVDTRAATCRRNDGIANLSPATLTYTWSDNNSGATRTNLLAGTYSVTATDGTCSRTISVVIADSCRCIEPIAIANATNPTCGQNNGVVTINVDNVVNYTFVWSSTLGNPTTAAGNARTGLPAGNYTVTVRRIADTTCFKTLNVVLTNNNQGCCQDFITPTSLLNWTGNCNATAEICIPVARTRFVSATNNGVALTSLFGSCASGVSLNLPVGNHNLVFTDSIGCKDSVAVKIVCVTPRTVNNRLLVGQADTTCLETNELVGTRYTITKIASTNLGYAEYYRLSGTLCIQSVGRVVGLERSCYVISDENGISDTTFINTTVYARQLIILPIANNNAATTPKNNRIRIDILRNDSTNGRLSSFRIVNKPKNGEAIIMADSSLLYIPKTDFCGKDVLEYEICNSAGCARAFVEIKVVCNEIRPLTGMSPNGDGLNDNWIIEGLDEFPNHVIRLYNRWGTGVFETKNYKNDWGGTWNGALLPDGTYFYLIENGEGKTISGYLQIQR
ncbi:MAG: hypothetical protein RL757_3352 [Bacteroidota bacterium]